VISHAKSELKTNVLETRSVSIIRVNAMTLTLVFNSDLTWLIA
jgi:hypothetical protein